MKRGNECALDRSKCPLPKRRGITFEEEGKQRHKPKACDLHHLAPYVILFSPDEEQSPLSELRFRASRAGSSRGFCHSVTVQRDYCITGQGVEGETPLLLECCTQVWINTSIFFFQSIEIQSSPTQLVSFSAFLCFTFFFQ